MAGAELSGIVVINKPGGMTSHDVVNKMRRLYNTRQVGHTGTLDPMATGVLVILVGRAAKAAEYITAADKRYLAGLRLGIKTDTGDITGEIQMRSDALPDAETVKTAVSRFKGEIRQIPPMYSAIKINGRKLVDLARQGILVDREARPVNIYSLAVSPVDEAEGEYKLDIHCSKGTYVRTLCEDIGSVLGCGGAMSSLQRIAAGTFSIGEAYAPGQIEAMTAAERTGILLPVENLFSEYPVLKLNGFFAKLAGSGAEIYQAKIKTSFADGDRLRIYDDDGFLALGEVRNFACGSAVKPIKYFRIE